jgi:hypothetical protein
MMLTGKQETRSWASAVKGASQIVDDVENSSDVEASDYVNSQSSSQPGTYVESNDREADIRPIQPAARGSYKRYCQGEVVMMCGHYGWIRAFQEIQHPHIGKTAGRIYVHKRDVRNGTVLMVGDKVSFYLYVDGQGLGAEYCRVLNRILPWSSPAWPAAAWNASTEGFLPKPVAVDPNVMAINPALLDSDDEASTCGDGCGSSVTGGKESESSDFSVTDEDGGLVTEALSRNPNVLPEGTCKDFLRPPLWKAFPSGFYPPPGLSVEAK